jgi:hypothetical protein
MRAGTSAGILAAGMVLSIGEAAPHHPELAKEIVARGRDPQMVRVWNAFLHYAKSRPGVAFLRKDEIARFGLQSPLTLRESETI